MNRLFVSAAVAALLLAAGAAPALAAAPASAPAARTAVPPIVYNTRKLSNGLTVYSSRDPAASNVAVTVWYGVGSKDDPEGRSGFAHLFEHLMFKANEKMPTESFDRLTEDVGGYNNASTWDDFTNYYEVVPANHLERLLWAESARMGGLVVDDADFRSERDVVKEEFRQRILASPYGRLFGLAVPLATYKVHPYKRPGIGNIAELNAATVEDARAFYKTFYRPDNASLIVVGNFDQAQLDRWVDEYFGALKAPGIPISRVTATEPPRTAPSSVDAWGPNIALPAVAITWLTPAASSADAPALQVLGSILSRGESSRLYSKLVYRDQLAQDIYGQFEPSADPGNFTAGAILAGSKTPQQGEAAVLAEVARLRDAPPTAAELDRAKTLLVTDALKERQAIDDRANALGFALVWEGDPARANDAIARLQAVSAADVQRVARTYLRDDRRTTIFYQDESKKPAGAAPFPPIPESATPGGTPAASTPPPAMDPPPVAAPIQAVIPAVAERTLPNGLRVIASRSTDLPLATVWLGVRAGGAADPVGKAGVADITADLLTKGAGGKTASEIAAQSEALGAEIGSAAGWDSASLNLTVAIDKADPAMAILADVAMRPALAPDELERLRTQALDGLSVALKSPGAIGGYVANTVAMAGTPYGHMLNGSPSSLKTISAADVRALYAARYRPDNAVLVVTGAFTPEQAFALAEKHFGGWAKPAAALPPMPAVTAAPKPRVVVVDLPGAGQAAVSVVGPGIKRSDPRYFQAQVSNAVLGVGFSSRLNQEIRIKRGLSYGAGSQVSARRLTGLIGASAQTKNESAPEVVELMLSELSRLGQEAAPEPEIASRKAVLTGGRGRQLETTEGLAGVIGGYAMQGVSLDELKAFDARVNGVSRDEARAIAGSLFDPKAA
ncbi:MAG: M16 family metallopeptidase, partial [Caulobacteraceae bacterium]